jgi:hypothetical protein
MNTIFKKLNYRDNKTIYVVHAPDSFKGATNDMKSVAMVKTASSASGKIQFIIAFVKTQKEVDDFARTLVPRLEDDAIFWLAYPKKTSKKYACEFNRDTGWAALGRQGYEGVRMVAIDEDWSALRFRRAENIKVMTRSFAMSETGRKKVTAAKKVSKTKKVR